ncbi:MAG: FecR family protein [Verrucomicrobiota bacterium]|jgi:hypothetical protein
MKKILPLVACAVALALIGAATLRSAEMGRKEGKAVVRAVHGNVEYESNGSWLKMKVNMDLAPGVRIRTGPDSYTDLFVNNSSTVRITQDTSMIIPEMFRVGPVRGADTETTLDLQTGTILGNVKKLSANSHYEIKTPHGIAGIRGTDFQVTCVSQPNGGYVVTFTSVTGEVVVSAIVGPPGTPPTVKVLRTGESWTPGQGDVVPTPQAVIAAAIDIIKNLPGGIPPSVNIPTPPPKPPPYTPPVTPSSPSS